MEWISFGIGFWTPIGIVVLIDWYRRRRNAIEVEKWLNEQRANKKQQH